MRPFPSLPGLSRATRAIASGAALTTTACTSLTPTTVVPDDIASRARVDLACPSVRIQRTVSGVAAEGCGQRVLYAQVFCSIRHDRSIACQPARVGQGIPPLSFGDATYTERLVPVSRAVGDDGRFGGEGFSGADAVEAARPLARANARGAYDLACPRSEVLPYLLPTASPRAFSILVATGRYGTTRLLGSVIVPGGDVSVAEGCGHRATYLPDETMHLWSIEPIVRP